MAPGPADTLASPDTGVAATNAALAWYRRLVFLGVLANIAVAGFGLVDPVTLITFLGFEPATPLVWPRFAAFLLILLSIFYIPGALDPAGRRFQAIYTVVCRAGGVAFFVVVGGPYLIFGLFDLAFGLPQGILLWRGLASARRAL